MNGFRFISKVKIDDPGPTLRTVEKLYNLLNERLSGWTVSMNENGSINVESVNIKIDGDDPIAVPPGSASVPPPPVGISTKHKICSVSWVNQDEDLGSYILGLLQSL